jgi:outer membrane protein assembly factor BamB
LLLGGGGLALLVICGATVYFLLFRDTGDDLLALAREAMASGSYSQAISQYEEFLEDFTGHPYESEARVELAMARLRRATEGRTDFTAALAIAESNVRDVENEPSFRDAQDELATLMPRIARGLADQAESVAADPAAAEPLVEQAERAVAMLANTKYVPNSLRDDVEMQAIRDTLARVERRKASYGQLQETIRLIEQAVSTGDTRAAYDAHRTLVREHPELASDEALLEMVEKTSIAEQNGIRFVAEEQAALTDELPTPVQISLALGHHRREGQVQASGAVCVHVDGAAYGVEAASGRLLWRRFVGFDEHAYVQASGDEVLIRDTRNHELLKIASANGDLQWRQPIGEPFADPLVVDNRAYVASESGKLYVVDLTSGARLGYIAFAQRLRVTPTADRDGSHLYVVGDHSSLYSIAVESFSCTGVRYLGHSTGSIRVPPVAVSNKLAVFENFGVESSRFHLISVDTDGTATETAFEQRMQGLVVTPPLNAGRRLVVLTDLGEMRVFEIGPQPGEDAVTALATRAAGSDRAVAQHALLTDRFIWVADDELAKYAVQPTDNSLPRLSIDETYRGSTFDHALTTIGGAIVHVRRPAGRLGAAVAATDIASGKTQWEIDLAVPPAGPPLIDTANAAITTANANGGVFVLDRAAIGRRVADQPIRARGEPTRPPQLTDGVAFGAGKIVFAGAPHAAGLLVYDASDRRQPARWLELPAALATPPMPMGDGFLAALDIGQVFYVDPSAADPLVAAFQPPLAPQSKVHWLPPGRAVDATDQCILTDGSDKIYLLQLTAGAQPALEATAEMPVEVPLSGPVAVLGAKAFIGRKDGGLAVVSLPSLEPGESASFSGRAVWGPFVVAGQILVATDAGELHCIAPGGATSWHVPLAHDELAGEPLAAGDAVVVAYRTGQVQKLNLADGAVVGTVDTGQSLAAGPIRLQQRLVIAAHDGTLLVVNEP